jgi:hypothetical protein
MVKRRGVYWVWWGNLSERGHFEYLGIHRRIILK